MITTLVVTLLVATPPTRPLKKAGLMGNGNWEMAKCPGFSHFAFTICQSRCVLQHAAGGDATQGRASTGSFQFETDEFWLNLHHFLYVLGRAEAKTSDASRPAVAGAPADAERGPAVLTDEERALWRQGVTAYATGLSRKDAVFDESLSSVARALADVDDAPTLSGTAIDAATVTILERAAPVYRKAWWPAHRAANREWHSSIQRLLDRHGPAILGFITKAYGMQWPGDGYPVHLSSYANWAGAYSTRARLLVVSSLDPIDKDLAGLETVFHEAMHQWDERMAAALLGEAGKLGKEVPNGLSHALIFFTAGEAVRRIDPGYVPYADVAGVWQRGMGSFKAALVEIWKPYLDGRGTRDDALAALVARTATEKRR
jgi:hypothetical protein